jgi:23S rRNA pseudouridine1911/1915/1917 synthase
VSGEKRALVARREDAGGRLDRFVVDALGRAGEAVSRAELQRWIDLGRVSFVGRGAGRAERLAKAGDKVREGDVIEVVPEPPARSSAAPDGGVPFEILYVDDAVVVVNKPPGVVVHPARGHETGTLVNGLLARGLFDAEAIRGDDEDAAGHLRPGIVHRIDKGTSGVLVVARTGAAREKLKAQFQAHTMGREYVALCVGEVEGRTIATLHARHPTDRLRFTSRVRSGNAKRAVTHVRVLERLGAATYVACTLETGRTHQIRVHLAETGTPVLGDPIYGRPLKDAPLRTIAETLGHQALHARLLTFVHPTSGALVKFEAPVPADFEQALAGLRAIAVDEGKLR